MERSSRVVGARYCFVYTMLPVSVPVPVLPLDGVRVSLFPLTQYGIVLTVPVDDVVVMVVPLTVYVPVSVDDGFDSGDWHEQPPPAALEHVAA